MSRRILDLEALKTVLPHRGVNLIPDQVEIDADGKRSVSRTRIPVADPRGRELLARLGANGPCLYEPFVAELLALTGIPLISERLAAAGKTAVFSMISRVVNAASAPLHGEIIAESRIIRDRGEFTVFGNVARCNGVVVLEAEVMSGSATLAEVGGNPVRPWLERCGEAIERTAFTWKDPRLVFIDRVISADPLGKVIRCAYTYPSDHPFIAGHFPGMPVMMGVTQLAAVADTAWYARGRFDLRDNVTVNATISRPDGTEVLDVRELVLTSDGPGPRILSTKRLAFREPVRPGDGLLITATIV